MQRVQARVRRVTPFTTARTVFRFRCHFRLETLWAWLMRRPVTGVFSQNWQCWAMVLSLETAALRRWQRRESYTRRPGLGKENIASHRFSGIVEQSSRPRDTCSNGQARRIAASPCPAEAFECPGS